MDRTPLIHAAIAVVIQILVGLLTGNWWLGGALACCWWMAREHTQAEYRWISKFGKGKRENLSWWCGFDTKVWDKGSVLDFVVPAAFCTVTYITLSK